MLRTTKIKNASALNIACFLLQGLYFTLLYIIISKDTFLNHFTLKAGQKTEKKLRGSALYAEGQLWMC
jgi:hypothetical protein